MFFKYPYTSFEKINLDWILNLATKLKADAESGAFDGFSPTITVEQVDGGYLLTITNRDGEQTVEIPIAHGSVVVDTSLSSTSSNPVQNRVITISLNAKYEKPSGGIPASDLAEAVRGSLNKADTAYQKPSTGVPVSDLANAVRGSLDKADTALQEVPTSVRLPLMDGVASSGLANEYSRGDHRHPLTTLHLTAILTELPTEISDVRVLSSMRVINCVFSNPGAITSNIEWTSSDGVLTLSGTMDGTTTVDIDLDVF